MLQQLLLSLPANAAASEPAFHAAVGAVPHLFFELVNSPCKWKHPTGPVFARRDEVSSNGISSSIAWGFCGASEAGSSLASSAEKNVKTTVVSSCCMSSPLKALSTPASASPCSAFLLQTCLQMPLNILGSNGK